MTSPMSDEQWILRLTLQHSRGLREYHREIASAVEIEFESLRAVDEMKAGLSTMDNAVVMMRRRNIRRDLVRRLANQLAEQLADTIEDAAGWHGPERQKSVKEAGLVRGVDQW